MNLFHLILQSALPWLLLLLLGVNTYSISAIEEYQTYIIHMDHCQKPAPHSTHESWHRSILKSLLSSPADDEEELLIYSYSHVMYGFSARLTPTQLFKIQNSQLILPHTRSHLASCWRRTHPSFWDYNKNQAYRLLLLMGKV